jgi:hypothetical protein
MIHGTGESIIPARYEPKRYVITAITQAANAVVTTSIDHDYNIGGIVRLYIPDGFGMHQADQKAVTIISVTSDTFTTDLDTRLFEAFSVPVTATQSAQSVPVGEANERLTSAQFNTLGE